jgi:hypothetical protein
MVCASLGIWWFIFLMGPTPVMVGSPRGYASERECHVAMFYEARRFSLFPAAEAGR